MNKAEFKARWESSDNGGGITYKDIADCAKSWGISQTPFTCHIDRITYQVLLAAQVEDAEDYNPSNYEDINSDDSETQDPMKIIITKSDSASALSCDRKTVLGNPFALTGSVSRESVVRGFRVYLKLVVMDGLTPDVAAGKVRDKFNLKISSAWKIPSRDEFLKALEDLQQELLNKKSISLGCHCLDHHEVTRSNSYVWQCHTEVIASYIFTRLGIEK